MFLYMAAYPGMGILGCQCPNTAMQLWIAARYVEGLSFLAAPFFITNKVPVRTVLGLYLGITSLAVWMILGVKIFPACYVEGVGLTLFKRAGECAISLIILGSAAHLYHRREKIDPFLRRRITLALIISALSSVLFALCTDVYGFINFLGHIAFIGSNYIIFCCVAAFGFEHPYDSIFRELKASAVTDPLTGLLNRQGFFEAAEKEVARAKKNNHSLEFLLMDIDNFKKVNDQYGHQVGDRVLRNFAGIIKDTCQSTACRLGGDEFAVLIKKENSDQFKACTGSAMARWKASDSTVQEIDISIGSATWSPDEPYHIVKLLAEADHRMYKIKQAKKKPGR
jgi:diguanylate cyclase (GGDEF)-like protein